MRLTSPDRTRSLLLDHADFPGGGAPGSWLFGSTLYWGESAAGDWQLTIEDTVGGGEGRLLSWQLDIYGDAVDDDDPYVFTDEYADLAGDAARSLLRDPAGIDLLNAAAVTGDLVLDLSPGGQSRVAGAALTIGRGTIIEQAIGGDGNDLLTGNAAANRLLGQRGDDFLAGRGGDDSLAGGAGDDHLTGGPGRDDLDGGPGADVLLGQRAGDVLRGGAGPDLLRGGQGDDRLAGGRSDDLLAGGGGDDELLGGRGADTLTGGPGRDDFRYTDLAERGDRITDFTLGADGDRLLIGDLLEGYAEGVSAASDFVGLLAVGSALELQVDHDGQGGDAVPLVTLEGFASADLDSLIAGGNLVLTAASA
jgi:Ca2+-binding RTX toxin-like protein